MKTPLLIGLTAMALFAPWLSGGEDVVYKDKMGKVIHLRVPVQRAVIFQLYELFPALNCWDRIVGVGRYTYDNDLILAARPEIQKLPSAGSGTDIDIEALLKMKPDVVVTWTYKPENVKFMQDKGLTVIAIYPDSFAEIYGLIELYGKMFQREKEAGLTVQQMDGLFNLVKARSLRIPAGQKRRVLWIGSRQNTVSGSGGLTNAMIEMTGGVNVAGGIQLRNADVSIETIIGWNPDVIFIWGNAQYGVRDILESSQWKFVKAVREGRVYKAPEWSTWSPRLALIVLWMSMKTYPDLYKDLDFQTAADDFYRKVFKMPYGKSGVR